MSSLIVLGSLAPLIVLIIGTILIFFLEDSAIRKYLTLTIVSAALIINTGLLIFFSLSDIIQRDFYLNLEKGTFLLIEIILLMGLIVSLFSREEVVNIANENYHDGLILTILLGLIGMVISSNIISIFSCFIVVMVLIGVIFYFGDYPKEFQLLRLFFLGIGLSTIMLFFASFLIYQEFGSLILTEIKIMSINDTSNVLISLFLFLGIGIPCGLFPFSIYHLKNYYQDSSYTNLFLFSIFSYISFFVILRFLNAFPFSLPLNGIIIMVISSIGLIISLVFVLTELFTSLDGDTFSIKKLFGFSLVSDFNMFVLFASFIVFFPSLGINPSAYFNVLIFSFL